MSNDPSASGEDETDTSRRTTKVAAPRGPVKAPAAPPSSPQRAAPAPFPSRPSAPSPNVERIGSTPSGSAETPSSSSGFSPRAVGDTVAVARSPAGKQLPEPSRLPLVDPRNYELIEEFARGGLGRILRARDVRLGRPVALKVMLRAGRESQLRFVREALVTARLQHPAIVPIYEAGRFERGELFYAMRFVSGQPLHRKLAKCRTLEERLALLPHVITVADAIAYAHSRCFIHRDLKPENILIGEFGETVVIDWGLAKELGDKRADDDTEDHSLSQAIRDDLTRHGSIIGTPVYMPPEQARGDAVDERADVYSLGAILYYVITGKRPYHAKTATLILQQVTAGPPVPVEQREPAAPKELVAIIKKAMSRKPDDRYPTAGELAAALTRFQTEQLVGAPGGRAGLIRRRGALAVAIVATLAILGALGVVIALGAERLVAAREQIEQGRLGERDAQLAATRRADEVVVLQARGAIRVDPTASVAWLKQLSPSFERWDEARVIALEARLRGVATVLSGHEDAVLAVAVSPDGQTLASGGADRAVRLWDLSARTSRVLDVHPRAVTAVAYSPDGAIVATAGEDGSLRLHLSSTDDVASLGVPDGPILAIAFSPDGARLASSGGEGKVHVWDVATGKGEVFVDHQGAVLSVAFSPDGRWLASGADDGTLTLRDLGARTSRALPRRIGAVTGLSFTKTGRELVSAGDDGILRLFSLDHGSEQVVATVQSRIEALVLSPDGSRYALATSDKEVVFGEVRGGAGRTYRLAGAARSLSFSPDGARLVVGCSDRTLRVFGTDAGEIVLPPLSADSSTLAFSPDGARLAAGTETGSLSIFDLSTGEVVKLEGHRGAVARAQFSADGQLLSSGGADGAVRIWDVATGRLRSVLPHPAAVLALDFSADGERLATGDADGLVRSWSLRDRRAVVLPRHTGPVHAVAYSPDGRSLAWAGGDRTVRVVDLDTSQARDLGRHAGRVLGLAYAPDGKVLASAGADRDVRLWDLDTGTSRSLAGATSSVVAVRFSRDGTHVAATGTDQAVRIWNARTGELEGRRQLDARGLDVQIAPDGRRLATSEAGGIVRVWPDDLPQGPDELRAWMAAATNAVILPDGRLGVR